MTLVYLYKIAHDRRTIQSLLFFLYNGLVIIMSTLTVALSRYEELVLYSTECGEYVEYDFICNNGCCENHFHCIAGRNLLQEIGII